MKTLFFLITFVLLVSANSAFAETPGCLEKMNTKNLDSVLQKSFATILNPKNVSVIPTGLPEDQFTVRSVKPIASVNGIVLVFVNFQIKDKPLESFSEPYEYNIKSEEIKEVVLPLNEGAESRMWSPNTTELSKCKPPSIKVKYSGCWKCEKAEKLEGKFLFKYEQQSWVFGETPKAVSTPVVKKSRDQDVRIAN